ncbi:MAG TPA: ferritin-like domain-containing protein [Bacteroidota bacterium]|nr:ferritin-like domain-containing protein [Bacteroidota bacterium]
MKEQYRKQITEMLTTAYWMEIETITNYIANSVNLDGVRAEEIKKSLAADVAEELTHAQNLARRIKEVGGRVPGSMEFRPMQKSLQPPTESTDVVAVIKGVIEAEDAAIEHYGKLIDLCGEAHDYVTQDLCITQLADEEGHRVTFAGFLKEYTKG